MSSENSNSNQQPSLVGGHIRYIQGAAEAGIGDITGSAAWKASGEQAKAQAISGMRTAGQERDAATSGFGKVEEAAGRMVGCEGMEQEGAASKKSA